MIDNSSIRFPRYGAIDISAFKTASEMASNSAIRAALGMSNNSAIQRLLEDANSPAMQAARGIVNNSAIQRLLEVANSPAMQAARGIANSSAIQKLLEVANSPAMHAARGMFNNPAIQRLLEVADGPALQAARGIINYQGSLLRLNGVLAGASYKAIIGSVLANETIEYARIAGTLDSVVGKSLILDTVSAGDLVFDDSTAPSDEVATKYLDNVFSLVRRYLSAANSVPEIHGLLQYILIIVALVGLYLNQNAASGEDIERQTAVIEEHLKPLRIDIERILRAKESEIVPRLHYQAVRRIFVKAERKINSETMGQVDFGEQVAIRRIDGKWIEFDFFDYICGCASHGWSPKKYFKRVHP
ncbi:hypothetical protein [Rhodopseudomonas palustris]|uniref:Uncharacterized protein n=1 Tax=Rhodopseudomonas palustris (strain BisB18) TaxID=316056 RepID=Q212H1_RHOPB